MSFEKYRTRLCKSLYTLKSAMDHTLESIAQKYNLTPLQTLILFLISEGYVNNISSLCKELGITQGNASALCKKMEKDGFLKRQRSADDERIVVLTLAERGEYALSCIYSEFQKWDSELDRISDSRYEMLLSTFDEISALLTNFPTPSKS